MTVTNDCEGESREKDGTKWGDTLDAEPWSCSVGSGAGNTCKIDNKLSVRLCHLFCFHCVCRWSHVERGWDGGIWKTRLAFAFYLSVMSFMSLQPSHTRLATSGIVPFLLPSQLTLQLPYGSLGPCHSSQHSQFWHLISDSESTELSFYKIYMWGHKLDEADWWDFPPLSLPSSSFLPFLLFKKNALYYLLAL